MLVFDEYLRMTDTRPFFCMVVDISVYEGLGFASCFVGH